MYLVGNDLLRCVKRLFDHEVSQSCLLELRRSGDDLLLKRWHPQLHLVSRNGVSEFRMPFLI